MKPSPAHGRNQIQYLSYLYHAHGWRGNTTDKLSSRFILKIQSSSVQQTFHFLARREDFQARRRRTEPRIPLLTRINRLQNGTRIDDSSRSLESAKICVN